MALCYKECLMYANLYSMVRMITELKSSVMNLLKYYI